MIEPKVNYTQEQCRLKATEFADMAASASNHATWRECMFSQKVWEERLTEAEKRDQAKTCDGI